MTGKASYDNGGGIGPWEIFGITFLEWVIRRYLSVVGMCLTWLVGRRYEVVEARYPLALPRQSLTLTYCTRHIGPKRWVAGKRQTYWDQPRR